MEWRDLSWDIPGREGKSSGSYRSKASSLLLRWHSQMLLGRKDFMRSSVPSPLFTSEYAAWKQNIRWTGKKRMLTRWESGVSVCDIQHSSVHVHGMPTSATHRIAFPTDGDWELRRQGRSRLWKRFDGGAVSNWKQIYLEIKITFFKTKHNKSKQGLGNSN